MKSVHTLLAMVVILAGLASAQSTTVQAKPLTDQDIQLLRQDVQAEKNQIITDTMQFNTKEAAAFWPVYNQYAEAQHALADKRIALIKDYAQNFATMDDAKAQSMTDRALGVESDTIALRKEYFPKFAKAIGAKRAAQFYQVDNRLSLMINLQLAANIPMMPQQQ